VLIRSHTDPEQLLSELRPMSEIVEPPPLRAPGSRDPDDDVVLAVAVASRADLIVSGDADLLALGAHAGIPILDPAAALARIAGGSNQP
jgi:predicted nucleic acid-binding protein